MLCECNSPSHQQHRHMRMCLCLSGHQLNYYLPATSHSHTAACEVELMNSAATMIMRHIPLYCEMLGKAGCNAFTYGARACNMTTFGNVLCMQLTLLELYILFVNDCIYMCHTTETHTCIAMFISASPNIYKCYTRSTNQDVAIITD